MSNYLSDKLETTPGAYIDHLCIIASEIHKPNQNEVLEDFICQPFEKICEVLGWQNNPTTHNLIKEAIEDEDNSLAVLMHQNKRNGFMATVHFPVCSSFYFNDDGNKPKRWQVSTGYCHVDYLYADSIAELFDKIVTKSEELFEKDLAKETSKI